MSFIRTDSIETVKKRNVTSEKSTTDNVPPDYILVKEMTFQIFFVLRLVDPLTDEATGLSGSASNATKMVCKYTTRETLENRISLFLYHEKS